MINSNASTQQILSLLFSDLFINLAAGWIGAAIILPASTKRVRFLNLWTLTTNIAFAIVSVWIAFELRIVSLL